ncbi:hypothetical protein BOTBODRAFT_116293 [Botryobasidium botryosum FD-172 SS1]|uniref:Tc1-like transposase DDE domain-containing protein n=1 Tax=Botryobasidium botryosum (strain FD-172 SS1) TaxID=930990 RepID=A0A067M2S2_BOTB1|nr:hypothetical protein BOTBODRAFT_116293 [Botryobasidium botryosum FD-172 SS1]
MASWSLGRYSVLPAMSQDGILSLQIVRDSFDGKQFADFIEGLLDQMNPFPGRNSVVVADNCHIHKSPVVREMIEDRFVPPK